MQGDDVSLQLTFHQSGPSRDVVGDVWLVDAYGSRLTKVEFHLGAASPAKNSQWFFHGPLAATRLAGVVEYRRNGCQQQKPPTFQAGGG